MNIQAAGGALAEVEELEALLVEVVRRRVRVGARPAARERVDDVEELRRVDEPERDRDRGRSARSSGSVTKKNDCRGFAPSISAAS